MSPSGICQCCGKFQRDLAACPTCGQMVGLCCWIFGKGCCLNCKVEHQDDPEPAA